MNVLIICNRFQRAGDSPWLMDDLASELVNQGAKVWVLVCDQHRPRPRAAYSPQPGLTVLSVGAERLLSTRWHRVISMLRSAWRVRRSVRALGRSTRVDAVVFPTVALQYARAAECLPSQVRRLHVVWDFFPVHHATIGSLPDNPFLIRTMKVMERWAIGSPDACLVMSQGGADFLRQYHPSIGSSSVIVPPWAPPVESRCGLPEGGPLVAVFGGQLERGRGVDVLLEAANLLQKRREEVRIVIAGSGPQEGELKRQADDLGLMNVEFVGMLDRNTYGAMLRESHVGIAITQANVAATSFPSKITDYARTGLPLLVATESHSDVGPMIERFGAGLTATAEDPLSIAAALMTFREKRKTGAISVMSDRSLAFFDQHLSVKVAARAVLAEASQGR